MTPSNETNSSIKIFWLDDDPIFRLGIFTALDDEKYADLEILAQAEISALNELLQQEIPDLLLLSIDLNRYPERLSSTFVLGKQLNNKYSDLGIFLLTPLGTNKTIEKIPGVKGCCPKDVPIEDLAKALRICAQNGTYFQEKKLSAPKNPAIGGWLYRECRLGLNKLDHDLNLIANYINSYPLSAWDLLFWKGRKRELIAARWLVLQLLPSEDNSPVQDQEELGNMEIVENSSASTTTSSSLSFSFSPELEPQNTFDLTLAKIKSSLNNCTENILEIDILKLDKKKELLIIIINQLKRILEELYIINLTSNELKEKKIIILKDLWRSSTINFLSRYYEKETNNKNSYSLWELILQESSIIEQESLINIPFVDELLAYWIIQENIIIDNEIYSYNSQKGQEIEEILLQNLILNIANTIIEFVLNNFSDYQSIRYNLYDQQWKSSRKIALFRNNLTWKYRQEKYWQNPQNIFEDQYKVLKLDYKGIIKGTITHPRQQELSNLEGFPWLVTMIIEFRDGIAKAVKGIVDIIGRSLVYILTEVIGKGIGLIGKGILQGIGKKIKS